MLIQEIMDNISRKTDITRSDEKTNRKEKKKRKKNHICDNKWTVESHAKHNILYIM